MGGAAPILDHMKKQVLAALCFLLSTFCAPAVAQTFKWKFTIPAPVFPSNQSSYHSSAADVPGNFAFTLFSRNTETQTYVQRIFWLSKSGTLLHSVDIENATGDSVSILQVSSTQLVVSFQTQTVTVVRKYVRRGKVITETDTTFSGDDYLPTNIRPSLVNASGFFAISNEGDFSTSVTRYTYR